MRPLEFNLENFLARNEMFELQAADLLLLVGESSPRLGLPQMCHAGNERIQEVPARWELPGMGAERAESHPRNGDAQIAAVCATQPWAEACGASPPENARASVS